MKRTPAVARRLGELLRAWQAATLRDDELARRFGDIEAFDQLRVDPYHRAVMRRWPSLAGPIGAYAEELLATRVCLVHGDFSPKNVLVGPDSLWVIDFEVAHVGDPVFDPAFMLNHLMLKAIHRPADAAAYRACAEAFVSSYEYGLPWRARARSGVAGRPRRLPDARPRGRQVTCRVPHRAGAAAGTRSRHEARHGSSRDARDRVAPPRGSASG